MSTARAMSDERAEREPRDEHCDLLRGRESVSKVWPARMLRTGAPGRASAGVTTRRLAGLLPLRHPRYRPSARGSHGVVTRSRVRRRCAGPQPGARQFPAGNRGGAGDPLHSTHGRRHDPARVRRRGAPGRRATRPDRAMTELRGGVAIVTGAAAGSGRAIAERRRRGRGRRRGRCRRARRRGYRRAGRRSRWHGPVRPCRHARPLGHRGARRRRGRAARARQQRGGGGHIAPHFPDATPADWGAALDLNLAARCAPPSSRSRR